MIKKSKRAFLYMVKIFRSVKKLIETNYIKEKQLNKTLLLFKQNRQSR